MEKINEVIQKKPIEFVENALGGICWEKQKEILLALRDNDIVAVRSCHNIGKSWISARAALWFLYGFIFSVVWSTAPTSRQVYNILWREIRSAHKRSKRPLGGELLKTRLELSDTWYAYGFATKEGEQFQGFHAESSNILGIIDEASGVSDEIFEAAESTLSSAGAKLLMIGNANKRSGYFADSFKRKGIYKIHISCFDTPNFTANNIRNVEDLKNCNLENIKIVAPYLITPKWALGILERYGENSTNFKVRCLGEFPDGDDDTLISIDDVERATEREVDVDDDDVEVISCDPARYGSDRAVIIVRKGLRILEKFVFAKSSEMELAGKIANLKLKYSKAIINVEAMGGGGGIVDRLREQDFEVNEVNTASKAIESDRFKNVRMELYWLLKEWLKYGSLPNDDDFLEMAEMKYKYLSTGQMQLESKEDMKKRLGKSPDVSDALAISFYKPIKRMEPDIDFI